MIEKRYGLETFKTNSSWWNTSLNIYNVYDDVLMSKWGPKNQTNVFVNFGALYLAKTTVSQKSDKLLKDLSFFFPNIKTDYKKSLSKVTGRRKEQ